MMRSAKSRKISAVMAFVMSLSVLATGCQKTSEDTGKLPSLDEVSITTTETEETDVPEVTTVPTETTTEATTTTEVTTEETEETTAPTETTPAETSAAETSETSAQTWSETEMSATMYVTENCYSREKAIIGSTPISQHYAGDTVEVVAITTPNTISLPRADLSTPTIFPIQSLLLPQQLPPRLPQRPQSPTAETPVPTALLTAVLPRTSTPAAILMMQTTR